ncbi:MAG: hypothetical protein WAN66_15100 [Limnoraphis robusta]|uniref:PEP-CTERM protein-sorting domain-containing protein n=1 Tax=Limnoraphis robusta CS-951 TaxID=1637645 RepID=A0A0F5YB78_9CYAN|nr:hypothetical protein [Limnoraphis robusta]KKD36186.1 hypothetical protein WN50_21250 [Limnoraphis robusta CS-951]KMW70520.1 hypothetical protein WN50_34650 [Limnoraphis robusta CS-951]
MNKNYISQLTLTTVSLACVCSAIAIEPSQATNIKKWQIDFFGDSGELVGEGSFSYDLDTETFVPDNFYTDDGFYVQTGLDSFNANLPEYNWSLGDSAGYYWWNEETKSPNNATISRYGIFFSDDSWFFGDPYFAEYFLRMNGTQGSGTWTHALSYDFFNEDFDEAEYGYYKVYSSGTWVAKPIPEPATLFGLIAVFGFGILFPQKQR